MQARLRCCAKATYETGWNVLRTTIGSTDVRGELLYVVYVRALIVIRFGMGHLGIG